jgi:hypothetical protein
MIARRSLLKGAAAALGAAAVSRAVPSFADSSEKAALLCVFLQGGYNALFGSAGSFVSTGAFGCTASNVMDLGNGLVIDGVTYGSRLNALPTIGDFALTHMAAVGVAHGQTAHDAAMASTWAMGNRNCGLVLASALGGDAPIKAANVGVGVVPNMESTEIGVSMQGVTDMKATLIALGVPIDPSVPRRTSSASALQNARGLSQRRLQRSASTLRSVRDGFSTVVDTVMHDPLASLDVAALSDAYGLPRGLSAIDSFTRQMMAAEVMVLAGANLVLAVDGGFGATSFWDSHADTDGRVVRNKMNNDILPGLCVFLDRMLMAPGRNVTVAIFGDFARSLPGSDHQPNLTVTVVGKNVLTGTTGMTDANVGLPQGAPAGPELWAYLGALTRCPTQPFGANPHTAITG